MEKSKPTIRLSEQKMKCLNCDYIGNPSNIRRHIQKKHSDEDLVKFNEQLLRKTAKSKGSSIHTCVKCGHKCATESGMKTHIRDKHPNVPIDPSQISLYDENDGGEPISKKFRAEKVDTDEITVLTNDSTKREKSTQNSQFEPARIQCPFDDCLVTVGMRSSLISHISDVHDASFQMEDRQFKTQAELDEWVAEKCDLSITTFAKQKTYVNGKLEVSYFNCRHEGKYERTGGKRHGHESKKQTGDLNCTAFMKMQKNVEDSEFYVSACFSHFGHKRSIASQKWNDNNRNELKSLILEGLTNRQIIDKLSKKYDKSNKMRYITSEDLRNLRNREQLIPGRWDNDDIKSITARINEKVYEDGFRHFESPKDASGEGFRLVIVTPTQLEMLERYGHRGVTLDDTHNATKYHLKLTTILVCDGRDRGIPAGFLLSHSTTGEDVEFLFQAIKDLFPDFKPAFVMTDDAFAFYNAYVKVFPNGRAQKLLCRWHIFRSWKKKAKELLKEEIILKVLPKLNELLKEPTEVEFRRRIGELFHYLENLDNDAGRKYLEYFRNNYIGNSETWSTAFRDGSIFHTSMFAESWHSFLKKQTLERKTYIRVDTLVEALLKAVNSILDKNEIQAERKLARACPRLTKNRKNCRKAVEMKSIYHAIETDAQFEGERAFLVGSVANGIENAYLVTEKSNCQCLKDENTHCDCGGCGYRHSCTCLSQEAGVCCKHVHLALLHYGKSENDEDGVDIQFHQPVIQLPGNFSPPRVDQTSSTSSRSRPDQARMEEAKRLYDKIVGESSSIFTHFRTQMAKDPDSVIRKMQSFLKDIDPYCPTQNPSLPARPTTKIVSARDTMNRHVKLQPRKSTRSTCPVSSPQQLVPRAQINICDICLEVDPHIPDDTDPCEMIAQITQWKRCQTCDLPVHFECANGQKTCRHCGQKFTLYDENDDEEEE